MVTCHIRYEIDPAKLQEFEIYARMWLPLVTRLGGEHHGYFLPHEGKNYEAFAAFSFESLAAYEVYREKMAVDEGCQAAYEYAKQTGCIIRIERQFMRPVLN
ncbi:NIPSNAP family protein [Aliamphritea ceti]|uniref:NIPSNAP family protein n=1 Tax=Aliamphritea ceti TaxID=1524258 RepID=UPI0021C44A75|nr:NIPSNAP family protein [Aliamphritea ceti]